MPTDNTDHWSVTVSRNGEEIVTIESNHLSGRDLSDEDERTIKIAAQQLLSFIGVYVSLSAFGDQADEPTEGDLLKDCHCETCNAHGSH